MNSAAPPLVINGSFLAQPPTGVQRFAIEICWALKPLFPDLEIVAPQNILPSAATAVLAPTIIGRFTGHLWEQLDLWWYVRRKKALLLNLDMKGPLLYRNKIMTIHDLNFLHNPRWVSPRFYYFYKFLVTTGVKTSRLVLTVSEFSKQEIQRLLHVPASQIAVIYNAVTNLREAAPGRDIPGDYVLSVSSTHPRKNLDRLIRAFLSLSDLTVRLVLVGLPHKEGIGKDIDGKNVEFLGYVDDATLANLYQHARAFVYPSLYEGFGIPPLEAMHYGCPVVAARASSLPEICGQAAVYIDPYEEESIAEGIQKVLYDGKLRQELIRKGYQQIQRFDWNQSALKLVEMLQNL